MVQTKLTPRSRLLIYTSAPIFVIACGLYLTLPLLLHRSFCPPSTFKSGPTNSVLWLVFGLLIIIACAASLLIRWGTRFPTDELLQRLPTARAPQHDQIIYLVVLLCGLGMSGAIWLNSLESYYCVSLEKIQIHPNVFESTHIFTWDDVWLVRAECERLKGGSLTGRVILALPNQVEIGITFNTESHISQRYDYDVLRTALAKKLYRYQISSSVTPNSCPQALFPLLLDWNLY